MEVCAVPDEAAPLIEASQHIDLPRRYLDEQVLGASVAFVLAVGVEKSLTVTSPAMSRQDTEPPHDGVAATYLRAALYCPNQLPARCPAREQKLRLSDPIPRGTAEPALGKNCQRSSDRFAADSLCHDEV